MKQNERKKKPWSNKQQCQKATYIIVNRDRNKKTHTHTHPCTHLTPLHTYTPTHTPTPQHHSHTHMEIHHVPRTSKTKTNKKQEHDQQIEHYSK